MEYFILKFKEKLRVFFYKTLGLLWDTFYRQFLYTVHCSGWPTHVIFWIMVVTENMEIFLHSCKIYLSLKLLLTWNKF